MRGCRTPPGRNDYVTPAGAGDKGGKGGKGGKGDQGYDGDKASILLWKVIVVM